jgi:ribosomal protein S18 acetylase RimI-like enzyme
MLHGKAIGYTYHVAEDRKGLIGDLYLLEEYSTLENENRLIGAAFNNLADLPGVTRIECQLMMLRAPYRRLLPGADKAEIYERNFMAIDLDLVPGLPSGRAAERLTLQNWSEERQDDAARLIASAYEGHIDSRINDQYRSAAGARRFLLNIVQYPGCGSFFPPASFFAYERSTGKMAGVSLASLVANDVGHITQICVAPSYSGQGIGYEMMRRSLESLHRHGCRKTSLTVTTANTGAIRLYERMGFATRRRFAAYVWSAL